MGLANILIKKLNPLILHVHTRTHVCPHMHKCAPRGMYTCHNVATRHFAGLVSRHVSAQLKLNFLQFKINP